MHTSQGLVPIEKLQVGDLVLSRREEGGPATSQPVVSKHVHDDRETYLVEYLVLKEPLPRYFVNDAGPALPGPGQRLDGC